MDDAEIRRNKICAYKVFGVNKTILAPVFIQSKRKINKFSDGGRDKSNRVIRVDGRNHWRFGKSKLKREKFCKKKRKKNLKLVN